MIDMDLGSMYLVYDKALVARSSLEMLFFKREYNELTGKKEWKEYHSLKHRG
jgi:hypothetical protein